MKILRLRDIAGRDLYAVILDLKGPNISLDLSLPLPHIKYISITDLSKKKKQKKVKK